MAELTILPRIDTADRDSALSWSASARSCKKVPAKSSIKGRNLRKRFEATCRSRKLPARVHLTHNGSTRAIANSKVVLILSREDSLPLQNFRVRPSSIFYCDIGAESTKQPRLRWPS